MPVKSQRFYKQVTNTSNMVIFKMTFTCGDVLYLNPFIKSSLEKILRSQFSLVADVHGLLLCFVFSTGFDIFKSVYSSLRILLINYRLNVHISDSSVDVGRCNTLFVFFE